MMFDLIVVGAGPGGLIAAGECAEAGLKVMILEKNDQPGKKLLATGSGQCNLTHDMPLDAFCSNYHEKQRYVRKVLYHFKPDMLRAYFENLGVALDVTPQGKVFPRSRKASEVLAALTGKAERGHAEIVTKHTVDRILKLEDGFSVEAGGTSYQAKAVLLATGGKSYPSLGTSGDGYALAKSLGHAIVPLRPSLAPVTTVEDALRDLSGITLQNAWITQWRNNRKVKEYKGDLLFTHEGLSGPVILNNSRDFMPGDVLCLNFARYDETSSPAAGLAAHLNAYGKYTVRKALDYIDVPRRVIDRILEISGIGLELRCAEMTKVQRAALVKTLTGLPLTLHEVGGYDRAMATAGGVATDEVNSTTMESKLVPGLYFAGEIMDVDGVTGGFNLQFAFSSGYTAAQSMIRVLSASE